MRCALLHFPLWFGLLKCTVTRWGRIITHSLSQWSDFLPSAAARIAALKDVDASKKEGVHMWVCVHVLLTYTSILSRQCMCVNHVCCYLCIKTDGKVSFQNMIYLSIYDIQPLSFSATLPTMRWHSIRFKSHGSYRVDMWNNTNTEMNTCFFELKNNRQQSWNRLTAVVVISAACRGQSEPAEYQVDCAAVSFPRHIRTGAADKHVEKAAPGSRDGLRSG